MKLLDIIYNLLMRWHIAALRQEVLNRKFDDLTDPTFLDRALAEEET